ncbi:hypothetical protein [Delftia tsuruhatensis]|uniref:hypothetical protein n=1 Tax=Delftia tsuruhatensis TaxID=180282 RepID=UPI0023DBFBBD|nr:hypothetical protein [Delftia tsuruhatensis]WEM00066.1 hypothetical protein PW274_07210 [Delftia tsuruhatensis]
MTPPIQLQRLPRRKKPARQRAFFMVALVPVVLLLAAMAGCSQAGAQDPQPTPQEQRIARAAARACEGLTPVFEHGSWVCLKER